MNTETAAMTQHDQQAEQQAWSQYLAALYASEAAWTAACVAWRDAVHSQLGGDAMRRYRAATDEADRCRDREQGARREWQRIAYPLYEVPTYRPSSGSAS